MATDGGLHDFALDALKRAGCIAWRCNSGRVQTRKGSWVTLSPSGTPDIVGMTVNATFLALELKTTKGKLSDDQADWLFRASQLGAICGVARSESDIQDFVERVKEASKGQGV